MWNSIISDDELNLDSADILLPFDANTLIEDTNEMYFVPAQTEGPPARGDFTGDYQFQVIIKPETNSKKFVYSEKLNKIYITQAIELPIQFAWDCIKSRSMNQQIFLIRATLQFADRGDAEQRPIRCRTHNAPQFNADVPETMIAHVLQSVLKDGDGGVLYCGDVNNARSWLSVCVSSPASLQPGVEFFSHTYKFMCKNSCSSGINRRPIEVTFTLEDYFGAILGRQTVGVRVCSCPRRDMGKDEGPPHGQPPLKRQRLLTQQSNNKVLIKCPGVDLTPYFLNQTVIGYENYLSILHVIRGLMHKDADVLRRREISTVQHDMLINDISHQLDNERSRVAVKQPVKIKHEAHNEDEKPKM